MSLSRMVLGVIDKSHRSVDGDLIIPKNRWVFCLRSSDAPFMHGRNSTSHQDNRPIVPVGSGGRMLERRTVNRGNGGSIPPTAVSKLRQFRSPHIGLCLSEETLKAGGPFYLVSMPGEVKDPTQGVNV